MRSRQVRLQTSGTHIQSGPHPKFMSNQNSPSTQRIKSGNNKEARKTSWISRNNLRVKEGNYNTHRVKPIGQITTSRVSRKGCNKFRVKSQKTKLTYKSKQKWYDHGN